jgi:hypothetical protein
MFITNKRREIYGSSPFSAAIFNADVSIGVIAEVMGVTRQTIYTWFDKNKKVDFASGVKRIALTHALEELIEEGKFPSPIGKKEKIRLIRMYFHKHLYRVAESTGEEMPDGLMG